MMVYPPVVIVDEHDAVIGEAPLQEAWENGLIHRLVYVILENEQGDVLLQRRSAHMHLFPGCWDISASGHVDDGHGYVEAAYTEVVEELGVATGLQLEEAAYFYSDQPYPNQPVVKRFIKIYKAQLQDLPHVLGAHEVSAVRWFSKAELAELVDNHPEKIAAGLAFTYAHVLSRDIALAVA